MGVKGRRECAAQRLKSKSFLSFFFLNKNQHRSYSIQFWNVRAQTSTQNHSTDFFCPETSILRLAGHQFLSAPREAGKCMLRVRLMGSDSNSISLPVSSEEGQFQKSPPLSRLVPLNHFCCFCLVERALKNTSILYVHIRWITNLLNTAKWNDWNANQPCRLVSEKRFERPGPSARTRRRGSENRHCKEIKT